MTTENTGEIRQVPEHEQGAPHLENVKIQETGHARIALALRALVAGVAAFAGALATASLGSDVIHAGQWWAAVAAGSVAVGAVIGVPDKALNTQAPRGEIQNMRQGR